MTGNEKSNESNGMNENQQNKWKTNRTNENQRNQQKTNAPHRNRTYSINMPYVCTYIPTHTLTRPRGPCNTPYSLLPTPFSVDTLFNKIPPPSPPPPRFSPPPPPPPPPPCQAQYLGKARTHGTGCIIPLSPPRTRRTEDRCEITRN